VTVNAAAGLLLGQKAPDLRAAMGMAQQAVDSGSAKRKLEEIAEFTSRHK
jgi:anthranilate phosphoribosyltransferase